MASDSLGEVAAFEKLVALVWKRENGGKMLDKPLTGKDLRKQIAESSRKTPAIIRRKIPIGEELGRLRVRVECASATDAVQLQSALNNSHAPTGAIVRVRKSSKGMAVLGDCVEVSLSEEGLLVCDEESVERAGSVLLWLVSEANGGLLEFSSALSSDQRRLMHTACDNNTLVHASAGPPSCRVLVVAGPGGEGRVEEVVGDIERRWEDRRRSAREERVRMQSLKRQATSNIVRGPFVGIGFGALDQTFSFSRKGEERRSSLSSLFGEAGGGPVLMNATYFKDLMDAFRAPQKEPFPEVDSK